MRFYANEQKVVTVSELKGIQCNGCGEYFDPRDDNILPFDVPQGLYERCGYDLCPTCHLNVIKTFKIVPSGFKIDPYCPSSFDRDPEYHQELFDIWKETGEWRDSGENIYEDYIIENVSCDKDEDLQINNETDEFIEDYFTEKTLKRIK